MIGRWQRYNGKTPAGYRVRGDDKMPPTTKLNRWWLRNMLWNTVMVFRVPLAYANLGYRVGCIAQNGRAMVLKEPVHHHTFRLLVGREPVTFFAVDLNGNEINLQGVSRTNRYQPAYRVVPLL